MPARGYQRLIPGWALLGLEGIDRSKSRGMLLSLRPWRCKSTRPLGPGTEGLLSQDRGVQERTLDGEHGARLSEP